MNLPENDYQILKLTDLFYNKYPNPPYREMLKKQKLNVDKYLKLYHKVKKINEFIESDKTARFVLANLEQMQNAVLSSINIEKEDERDERIVLAQKGKLVLETMLPMIDTLIKKANDTVMQYQGEDNFLYTKCYSQETK